MSEILAFFAEYWEPARFWFGGILCVLGGLAAIVGAIGVLRFPDFYTRIHASSVTDTLAAGLLLIGMMFLVPGWIVLFKLVFIGLVLMITSPTGSHAVVHAAHVAELEPQIGPVGDEAGIDTTTEAR